MAELSEIYDLESQVEAAIQSALTTGGLQAISPESEIVLRKDRPRVEVTCQLGGADDRNYSLCPDGVYRHGLYAIGASLYVLTGVREESQEADETHSYYKAKVREVMSSILTTQAMDNLKLRRCVPSGTSGKAVTQEGYEESTLTFDMVVEIKQTAWPV